LGNRIPLTNLKLLVVGGLMRSMVECYGSLLCNASGPRGRLVKHAAEAKHAERMARIREENEPPAN
jgi:hypothetical protein